MSEEFDIKDYQIHLPPLGEGTFGRVFRATYRGISDRALKIFRPGAVDLSTMARELEKLSSVAEHHGIVTLHDFDLLHDPPYYAMGLHADPNEKDNTWETRTLERMCGHVDHREGWRLLKEIADALAYLHRHQIIHCDIKPSNMLLTDETPHRVKICDFGQSRGLAMDGFEPVGTPLYAPPEQLRDPVDSSDGKGFRWDVYSFGVVAYRLLTGKLPRLQELAEAERNSFDPEATVVESSLEATLAEAEGRERIDGERLATLVEAVEDVRWPDDIPISTERRELINSCLSLDPNNRPADMREVWNAMRTIDNQVMVKRARRLNALFGTLLFVALWASGFAFVQANKAKEASTSAETSREQAEELAFFIMKTLNNGELTGPGLDDLYEHIADHSEAYIENMPKDRDSARLLRATANTTSLRGRQALEQNNLEEALQRFQQAYEIRSNLAESQPNAKDLAWLASRDLMVLGHLHELRKEYDIALEKFESALDWRSRDLDFSQSLGTIELRQLSECVRAAGRIQRQLEDDAKAVRIYKTALTWYDTALAEAAPASALGMGRDLLPLLRDLGTAELQTGKLDEAAATFERLMNVSQEIRTGMPAFRGEADSAYIASLGALGRIQLANGRPEAAMTLFREEIKLLERETRVRPGDSKLKMALAEAYSHAADCYDPKIDEERLRAISLLEEAVTELTTVPSDQRVEIGAESRLVDYNSRISDLLAVEE
ncbi:MAG: protein kinase [Verrucomicrobiales bacterium]|nr:protein kinase [Verrucomicrobiales bacterium]